MSWRWDSLERKEPEHALLFFIEAVLDGGDSPVAHVSPAATSLLDGELETVSL